VLHDDVLCLHCTLQPPMSTVVLSLSWAHDQWLSLLVTNTAFLLHCSCSSDVEVQSADESNIDQVFVTV